MVRAVHLGYLCDGCRARVPVYTFTRSNAATSSTPPVDRSVQCPQCHAARHVSFSEIQNLERWEEIVAADGNAA
ncbi:MAG TPA: hypothetical protein VFI82_15950 [Terriglobales bacterium]|jgi:hypothetical protein|nr:hypothetical protein [Terriglobales bacterium]